MYYLFKKLNEYILRLLGERCVLVDCGQVAEVLWLEWGGEGGGGEPFQAESFTWRGGECSLNAPPPLEMLSGSFRGVLGDKSGSQAGNKTWRPHMTRYEFRFHLEGNGMLWQVVRRKAGDQISSMWSLPLSKGMHDGGQGRSRFGDGRLLKRLLAILQMRSDQHMDQSRGSAHGEEGDIIPQPDPGDRLRFVITSTAYILECCPQPCFGSHPDLQLGVADSLQRFAIGFSKIRATRTFFLPSALSCRLNLGVYGVSTRPNAGLRAEGRECMW